MEIMRRVIATLILVLCTFTAMAQMPVVKVENEKGETISTASLLDGKTPIVLSFWTVSCKPCELELNAINDLMPDWLDEVDFRVIAVSADDSRSSSKARALASGMGWDDFTVLYDKNQDFKRAWNVGLMPHLFVLDGNGKVVYTHVGYSAGAESEVFEAIKKAAL